MIIKGDPHNEHALNPMAALNSKTKGANSLYRQIKRPISQRDNECS